MNRKENASQGSMKLPKENPFRVPENYFENFSEKLEVKMDERKSRSGKTITIWKQYKSYFSLAAGFILFAAISYSLLHFILSTNSEILPGNDHYAEFIEYEIENYDENTLFQAVTESTNQEEINDEELEIDKMIEYLIKEDIELDLIINEL